jgi:hypothetical protein
VTFREHNFSFKRFLKVNEILLEVTLVGSISWVLVYLVESLAEGEGRGERGEGRGGEGREERKSTSHYQTEDKVIQAPNFVSLLVHPPNLFQGWKVPKTS